MKTEILQPHPDSVPAELQLFMNCIYEYKKGIRSMVLLTMSSRHREFATRRLESNGISYEIQTVSPEKMNLFFGREECLQVIRKIVIRPLNQLSAEEDFILGAMLGYDICQQCVRFCSRKQQASA